MTQLHYAMSQSVLWISLTKVFTPSTVLGLSNTEAISCCFQKSGASTVTEHGKLHITRTTATHTSCCRVLSNTVVIHMYTIPCHIMAYPVIWGHNMPCQILFRPCEIVSDHVISNHVISGHVISYHTISNHTTSYNVVSHHTTSSHIISDHTMRYHSIPSHSVSYLTYHIIHIVLSCSIISYPIISDLIPPSHIISYHIISYHSLLYHTMFICDRISHISRGRSVFGKVREGAPKETGAIGPGRCRAGGCCEPGVPVQRCRHVRKGFCCAVRSV